MLIVGAVVLCPAILLPMAHFSSPYTVWLVVMTFGAVGHHLPSFLRTYGDRALFERFRVRLIVAPILLFSLTLGFSLRDLHGMLLVSMCWSIWHGMMQHFGFLRIYDSKVRATDPLTARLDWWISASWFGLCLVHSPNQGSSLLSALYDSGIPIVTPQYISIVRAVFVTLTAAITLLYIVHAVWGKQPRSWMKLGLLVGTFAYVWLVRVMTHDPYLSVALFELLHDMQYLAIVWAFNRKLVEKGGRGVLPTFFYRARAASIFAYVGACMAYGSFALFIYTKMETGVFKQVMEAFLITSGLLHFYYDGFIWKLKQPDTQRGLGLEEKSKSYIPSWDGLGQAALVGIAVILLAGIELRGASADEFARAQSIVSATPDSPTALNNYASLLLKRGQIEDAVPLYRKAVKLQPDFKTARESLSDALALLANDRANAGRLDEAFALNREAVSLEPNSADRHNSLAVMLAQAGKYDEAEASFRRAIELDPSFDQARANLNALLQMRGQR